MTFLKNKNFPFCYVFYELIVIQITINFVIQTTVIYKLYICIYIYNRIFLNISINVCSKE